MDGDIHLSIIFLLQMFKNLSKFIPLLSVAAVGTVPLLAWRQNVNSYEQIRNRITKPSVDLELPSNLCLI